MTRFAVFCSDPLRPRIVDPAFREEAAAASSSGFEVIVVDHDELDHRIDVAAALRRMPSGAAGRAVYRGWMLRSQAYSALHAGLAERGITLATTPEAYDICHHAPGTYPMLAGWLPETAFVGLEAVNDAERIRAALARFTGAPVILKDWVKSQASAYWNEACFIPDSASMEAVMRVVRRFLELQGDALAGGLVFKRHIPLQPDGVEPFECRAFIIDGAVVGCWPRSGDGLEYGLPPASLVEAVAGRLSGYFASADFGIGADGGWHLLEVGDGQVSGLPQAGMAADLHRALWRWLE